MKKRKNKIVKMKEDEKGEEEGVKKERSPSLAKEKRKEIFS